MEQETKMCPFCGEEILAIAKKCKHCGEWLDKDEEQKEMVPCPVCGELIEVKTKKCPYCNESINSQEQNHSTNYNNITHKCASDETKSGSSRLKVITSILVILGILVVIAVVSSKFFFSSDASSSLISNKSPNNSGEIKDAYLKLIDEYKAEAKKASADMGSDLDGFAYGYFLYDITGDGIPELWLQTGTCLQDIGIDIYTYQDGIDRIYHGDSYYCSYYDNKDYILQVEYSQGYAVWTKLSYSDGKIQAEVNDIGDIAEPQNRKYQNPTGEQIELTPLKDNSIIMSAFNMSSAEDGTIVTHQDEVPDINNEDAFFKDLVGDWDKMHIVGGFDESDGCPYAKNVKFYGQVMSGIKAAQTKHDVLSKKPDYEQHSSNIVVKRISSTRVRCDFDKQTASNGKIKHHPSCYLYFVKESDGIWRIDEESDAVTDKNLNK